MQVQLFVTCLIDSLFPAVGEAVLTLLRSAGAEVGFPTGQTCCGQPAFNAGHWGEAAKMARRTIEVFERCEGSVVVPSGSCAHMLRHGYLELFRDEPLWLPRAERLAERTYELSEFLVEQVGVQGFAVRYPHKLAYHPSCHLLRGLGIVEPPLQLLRSLEGSEVVPLAPECCGFGGVFSVDHGEISAEMLHRKIKAIIDSEAEIVVAADVSCLMHMEGGLRKLGSKVRALHLAQALVGQEGGLR